MLSHFRAYTRSHSRSNFRLWLFVLTFLTSGSLLSGCTHLPISRQIDKITIGMDKDQVLDEIGDPKRTFRSNSQDHWIYVYFEENNEWRRQVDFRDGKVFKVGRPVAKRNWESELENSETMEEFESKARARAQRSKPSDFKEIDSKDDPTTSDQNKK